MGTTDGEDSEVRSLASLVFYRCCSCAHAEHTLLAILNTLGSSLPLLAPHSTSASRPVTPSRHT